MPENALLQHKQLTVLQQIQELKNWHREQQNKLNNEGSSVDKSIEKNGPDIQSTQLHVQNSSSQNNFDEVPIKGANFHFSEVAENNVMPNEVHVGENHQNKGKVKFNFLKKGEGIARFGMGPRKIQKYRVQNKRTLNLVDNSNKCSTGRVTNNEESEHLTVEKENAKSNDNLALQPPDLKLNFKNWRSFLSSGKADHLIEKAIANNQLELFHPNSSIDSSTASIMEKLLVVGRKQLKEQEELRVFETMEQHVLESSFCSTSSYVAKLMENAVISTPVKNSPPKPNPHITIAQRKQLPIVSVKNNENVEKNSEERPEVLAWVQPDVSDNELQIQNIDDSEESLHVRFASEVEFKSFAECSESLNNSSKKETNHQEFNENVEWKEESGESSSSCCSDYSTTYSSSDEDMRPISPPKHPSPVQSIQMEGVKPLKLVVAQSTKHSKSSDKMAEFPPILGSKLKELESEIEVFRSENNKIKAIRDNLEKRQRQLQQEKRSFLRELEEEKKKLAENAAKIEEEKQKLSKEKFIFEKHSKSLMKNPTKEERKEMQALREQLSEIKEELNKKESRWGAAQARVRNQVKLLEEDNKKLREEVDMLRKQSRHLEFLTQKKKKPFNNTKLIHAINDYISSMPSEENALKITKDTGGYFSSKPDSVNIAMDNEISPKILTVKVIKESVSSDATKVIHVAANHTLGENPAVVCITSPLLESASSEQGPSVSSKTIEPSINQCHQIIKDKEETSRTLGAFVKNVAKEVSNENSVETVYPDGKREIRYKNGNVKKIDPFSENEKIIYFNGDIKEITRDGTVKYYFAEDRIWRTTLPDGFEIVDFPNGQVEKRNTSGIVEISYPNGSKKISYPDGSEERHYVDGSTEKIDSNKRTVRCFPNGQKEIHTEEFARREYPDGTVKTVYTDGTSETVYADGRVRVKDKHGNLVMDSRPGAS